MIYHFKNKLIGGTMKITGFTDLGSQVPGLYTSKFRIGKKIVFSVYSGNYDASERERTDIRFLKRQGISDQEIRDFLIRLCEKKIPEV